MLLPISFVRILKTNGFNVEITQQETDCIGTTYSITRENADKISFILLIETGMSAEDFIGNLYSKLRDFEYAEEDEDLDYNTLKFCENNIQKIISLAETFFSGTIPTILFVFCFETGDASCNYWEETALINTNAVNLTVASLEDSFSSYFENSLSNDSDEDYSVAVEDVLNNSGLQWRKFEAGVKIDGYKIMFI